MNKCICGKSFLKGQSFNGHKSRCKIHLESVGKTIKHSKRKACSVEQKKKISLAVKKFYIDKKPTGIASSPEKEEERKRKISESMKKNTNAGGLRLGSGRGIKTWYLSHIAGNVYLRSSYELEYAKYLDAMNIKWKQNTESFIYIWKNDKHKYYPDFYLIDENLYIEIKGYETEKDIAKWKYFPHSLKILKLKDLKELNIL